MLGESVAIKVTANAQDWTWELIDDNGKTITCGISGSQEAAMESPGAPSGCRPTSR